MYSICMGHGFSKYHTLIERAVFVAVLLCIVRAVDARFVRLPGRHPLPGGVWLFARRQQNPNTDDAEFHSKHPSSFLACPVFSVYHGSVCILFVPFAPLCYDDPKLISDNRTQ